MATLAPASRRAIFAGDYVDVCDGIALLPHGNAHQHRLTRGGLAHVWSYEGQLSVQWSLLPVEGGFYQLQNVHSGKALDVFEQSTDFAPIHQWDDLGQQSAHWEIVPIDDMLFGQMALRNRMSDLCLTVPILSYESYASAKRAFGSRVGHWDDRLGGRAPGVVAHPESRWDQSPSA